MNEGLFEKYSKVLKEKKSEKEELIGILQEITGIMFTPQELSISKKCISFQTSSVKKSIVHQKRIEDALQQKGYSIKI